MRPKELIRRAETEVRIEDVLKDLFDIDVPYDAGDWKAECPLGYEHSDGGRSKAMRVYSESNSAWCFSHASKYTPLTLWRLKAEVSRQQGARDLLRFYGINTEPPTVEERWKALDDPLPVSQEIDVDSLRELLIQYARTLPGYEMGQYDPEALDLMTGLIKTARSFSADASYDTIENWLNTSKRKLETYWRNREQSRLLH